MASILDASALLAFLFGESGAERVEVEIASGATSTVNWAEVWQKMLDRGAPPEEGKTAVLRAGLELVSLSTDTAERAARLRDATREAGLSLADRCCLALAAERGVTALTTDAAWTSVDLGIDVQLIR